MVGNQRLCCDEARYAASYDDNILHASLIFLHIACTKKCAQRLLMTGIACIVSTPCNERQHLPVAATGRSTVGAAMAHVRIFSWRHLLFGRDIMLRCRLASMIAEWFCKLPWRPDMLHTLLCGPVIVPVGLCILLFNIV